MRSPATGTEGGKTARRLKAIHIHYPISLPTITSSHRDFQIDLSPPLELYLSCQHSNPTATEAYSSSFRLITAN